LRLLEGNTRLRTPGGVPVYECRGGGYPSENTGGGYPPVNAGSTCLRIPEGGMPASEYRRGGSPGWFSRGLPENTGGGFTWVGVGAIGSRWAPAPSAPVSFSIVLC